MNKKRVLLVASDFAPSACFKRLEPVLQERGFSVTLIVGEGKPMRGMARDVALAASRADMVVLGMSNPAEHAELEIAAGKEAKSIGVPYGFYGDVRRSWRLARSGLWFGDIAKDAAFYFGVTQDDADAARVVFPAAQLVGTGNPLREDMAFPRLNRESVRARMNILPHENFVLAPGGTFSAKNMASWMMLIEALSSLSSSGDSFQLVLTAHPGDRIPHAIDAITQEKMQLYQELVSFSPVPTQIITRDVLATSDMVPGADIVVEFASSIGIEAACQNIPVVTLGFEVLLRELERVSGSRVPEAVEDGLSELVMADASALASTIKRLLTPEGFAPMRARQCEVCTKPAERGGALRAMADVLKTI